MNEVAKQRAMALFIAVIMVLGTVGFALMSQVPDNPEPVEMPDVIDRPLTPEERVSILRSGRALIEYFYNVTCMECVDRAEMYRNFVQSKEFGGYLTLSYGVAENETMDWMLNLDGTRIELSGVNSTHGLRELFCEVAIWKPDICILDEV